MLPEQKLDDLLARHQMVESELASQLAPTTYVRLSREFAELGPVVEAIKAYREVTGEIAGLELLLQDASTDAEMRALAAGQKTARPQTPAPRAGKILAALLPHDAAEGG